MCLCQGTFVSWSEMCRSVHVCVLVCVCHSNMCASRRVFVRKMWGWYVCECDSHHLTVGLFSSSWALWRKPGGLPGGVLFTHNDLLAAKLLSHSSSPCPVGEGCAGSQCPPGFPDAWHFPATFSEAHPPTSRLLSLLPHSCHLRAASLSAASQPSSSLKLGLFPHPTSVFTLLHFTSTFTTPPSAYLPLTS